VANHEVAWIAPMKMEIWLVLALNRLIKLAITCLYVMKLAI